MAEIKFKAGDTVRLKYQPDCRLFIIESRTQTCYAGVQQVFYRGRLFWETRGGASSERGVRTEYQEFSSIEVEAIPEIKDSPEIKKIKKELTAATKLKESYIKKQDFGRAADIREEERRLKAVLIILEEQGL